MKYILIIFLIFITIEINAQDCKYVDYYPLIESAIKEYEEKRYKKAEKQFALAFSKTDFPLGKHLNMALLNAMKRNNSDLARKISIDLAKRGVSFKYFIKMKKFKWYDQFKEDFPEYSNFYFNNFNSELREEVTKVLELDKNFNRRYHQWRRGEINLSIDDLIHGATEIYNDFKMIVDKYGFPSEEKMGYNYIVNKNKIDRYPISTLLVHIYQRGVLFLENELEGIVCEGGLHPNTMKALTSMRGFGDSSGIEQEMKIRFYKVKN